eukprot:4233837-Amphidinium_carterae.3
MVKKSRKASTTLGTLKLEAVFTYAITNAKKDIETYEEVVEKWSRENPPGRDFSFKSTQDTSIGGYHIVTPHKKRNKSIEGSLWALTVSGFTLNVDHRDLGLEEGNHMIHTIA